LSGQALKFVSDPDQDRFGSESMAQKSQFAVVKAGAESQAPSVSVESHHWYEYNVDQTGIDASVKPAAGFRNRISIAPLALTRIEFDEVHASRPHVDYSWCI
jgi:hypothetical protein